MTYGFGIIRFTVTVFIPLNAADGGKTTNKRRPRINAASHQKNTAFTRGKWEKTRYNLAIYTIQTFTILSQPSSNNANFYPWQMSAVSISTSFHFHHLWDDRTREDILSSVSITTIFTSHSTSTRGDCLVLYTMAACLSGNAEHHTSNRICQRYSPQLLK